MSSALLVCDDPRRRDDREYRRVSRILCSHLWPSQSIHRKMDFDDVVRRLCAVVG